MTPARAAAITDLDDVVVLVDRHDTELGVAPKLDAHRDGRLHRAVSVMLFDPVGRVLLQRRAGSKYHSPGLWSNTCCGHPRPGESVIDAARRRLWDELRIAQCQLVAVSEFVYRVALADGLVEHELDHVLIGRWAGVAEANPGEVSAVAWSERRELGVQMAMAPERYTAWLGDVLAHACRFEGRLGG